MAGSPEQQYSHFKRTAGLGPIRVRLFLQSSRTASQRLDTFPSRPTWQLVRSLLWVASVRASNPIETVAADGTVMRAEDPISLR